MTIAHPDSRPLPRWHGAQRRIGLTGGIASGKSSVSRYLAEQHALPILDADMFAREALDPGNAATTTVLERYGKAVTYPSDQTHLRLDRSALGKIVFSSPHERRWLEQLMHPIVQRRFYKELAALKEAPIVVLIIPLLFEAKLTGLCSEVWVVDCNPTQQLQRLVNRDGLTLQEAEQRIASQWPLERKRPLADLVIDNSGTPEAWRHQISSLCLTQPPIT